MKCFLLLTIFGLMATASTAQPDPWRQIDPTTSARTDQLRTWQSLMLDTARLKQILTQAPHEATTRVRASPTELIIPLPDGRRQAFRIVRYDLFASDAPSPYPRWLSGYGLSTDGENNRIRFDWTASGFSLYGQLTGSSFYIEPQPNAVHYISFYKKDHLRVPKAVDCRLSRQADARKAAEPPPVKNDHCSLRTYRLAIATTGEYANYYGAFSAEDEELVLAAIFRTINRVNSIYEIDLGVRLMLVPETDQLLFYDPDNDPFTNHSPLDLIRENQQLIDATLGSDGYDIGHVFGTGGGGFAALGVACKSASKAQGQTGLPQPEGEIFYVDYVAHEIGHQLGAAHTFNGNAGACNGQRSVGSAYEPGSGSTIMGYAGICAEHNLQLSSDAYFHAASIEQIHHYISDANRGGACATVIPPPDAPPVVTAGDDAFVPIGTPFVLQATGADPDDDQLSYCWEQWDPEIAPLTPPQPENSVGPLFRSRPPQLSTARYFPALTSIRTATQSPWEVLPAVDRKANFRVTVRESASPGCTASDDQQLTFVSSAGPFTVLTPEQQVNWPEGSVQTIRWEVAGTDQAPVNCQEVDVLLSYDGGLSFPVTVAVGLPNNGLANVQLPAGTTDQARLMVRCTDNVFFDISDQDFKIRQSNAGYDLAARPLWQTACAGTTDELKYQLDVTTFGGLEDEIDLSVTQLPAGISAQLEAASVAAGSNTILRLSSLQALAPGMYSIRVRGQGRRGNKFLELFLEIRGKPQPPDLSTPANGSHQQSPFPSLSWQREAAATQYELQIATDPAFQDIRIQSAVFVPRFSVNAALDGATAYYWRVRSINDCAVGEWSAAFSFTTAPCRLYVSEDVPHPISATGPSTIRSTIEVMDEGNILDVNVIDLQGTHTWIHDLRFTLVSPAGTERDLLDAVCSSEDDFFLSLDDQAGDIPLPCPPTDGLAHRPLSGLLLLNGEEAQGTWTLVVSDRFTQDGGSLDGWGLQVCIAGDAALPVDWLSVEARPAGKYILLTWTTGTELNNAGFGIQRRQADEPSFREIAWVAGQGHSTTPQTYAFKDEDVRPNQNYYYRLHQMDFDGQEQFSEIVTAMISGPTAAWQVYPNPVVDRVHLRAPHRRWESAQISIFSVRGRLLNQFTASDGFNTQQLPAGLYWLRLPTDRGWQWERLAVIR